MKHEMGCHFTFHISHFRIQAFSFQVYETRDRRSPQPPQQHYMRFLFVLVHGLHGDKSDFKPLHDALVAVRYGLPRIPECSIDISSTPSFRTSPLLIKSSYLSVTMVCWRLILASKLEEVDYMERYCRRL